MDDVIAALERAAHKAERRLLGPVVIAALGAAALATALLSNWRDESGTATPVTTAATEAAPVTADANTSEEAPKPKERVEPKRAATRVRNSRGRKPRVVESKPAHESSRTQLLPDEDAVIDPSRGLR
jgi:hypothetical protein